MRFPPLAQRGRALVLFVIVVQPQEAFVIVGIWDSRAGGARVRRHQIVVVAVVRIGGDHISVVALRYVAEAVDFALSDGCTARIASSSVCRPRRNCPASDRMDRRRNCSRSRYRRRRRSGFSGWTDGRDKAKPVRLPIRMRSVAEMRARTSGVVTVSSRMYRNGLSAGCTSGTSGCRIRRRSVR